MIDEFQVLYRAGTGPVMRCVVNAADESEAREMFAGFAIEHVRNLGPWLRDNQAWYSVEAAAKYLGVSKGTIYGLIKMGRLNAPGAGDAVFHRSKLDDLRAGGFAIRKKRNPEPAPKFKEAA